MVGAVYEEEEETGLYRWKDLSPDADFAGLGVKLSRALRQAGYVLLWDPQLVCDLEQTDR